MSERLPRVTAEKCLAIVQRYVDRVAGPGWEPALYPPGHEGPMWVASLEGVGEWAIGIARDDKVIWPDGVFVEPVASWCLGLYPSN